MINRLQPIILQKEKEVAALQAEIAATPNHPILQVMQDHQKAAHTQRFQQALATAPLTVIAEIKRKSPSKGPLATIANPLTLAKQYIEGGAGALSILTDEMFFGGSLRDLSQVAKELPQPVPILRKDFTIHEIQIAEAIVAGADAILAIVAVLGERTKMIIDKARYFGIDVLVEVHDAAELDIALAAGADIIGINNRNLTTFEVDTQQAFKLARYIPDHIIKVAESGIDNPGLAKEYHAAGFQAVLIGEALVTAAQPALFIQACTHA